MTTPLVKTWVACKTPSSENPTDVLTHLYAKDVKPDMVAAPIGLEQYLPCVQNVTDKYMPVRNPDGTCTPTFVPVAFRGAIGGGLTKRQAEQACATTDNITSSYSCGDDGCTPNPYCSNGEENCYPTKEECEATPGMCFKPNLGSRLKTQVPLYLMSGNNTRACRFRYLDSLKTHINQVSSELGITMNQRNCTEVTPNNPLKYNEWCAFPADTTIFPNIRLQVRDDDNGYMCESGYCVPVEKGRFADETINPVGLEYGDICTLSYKKCGDTPCCPGQECINSNGLLKCTGKCTDGQTQKCGDSEKTNVTYCNPNDETCHIDSQTGIAQCKPKHFLCGNEICGKDITCRANIGGPGISKCIDENPAGMGAYGSYGSYGSEMYYVDEDIY